MTGPSHLQPSRVRWAAVLLVLVQAAALALLIDGRTYAVVMSLLAIGSLQSRWRISPERAPHWLWLALLAVVLAVKHRLAPEALNEQVTFFNTVVAFEAARYLVLLQVVQLWINRPGNRLPAWFLSLSVLGMVFASNVRLNPSTRPTAVVLSLLFVVAMALFATFHRRRATRSGSQLGRAVMIGVLILIALAGIGVSRLLQHFEGDIERWLAGQRVGNVPSEATTGFSGRGNLGAISAWKQFGGEQIALRIRAEQSPGYLRGKVFDELRDTSWTEALSVRHLKPERGLVVKPLRPSDSIYPVELEHGPAPVVGAVLDFWPSPITGERLFLPQDTAFVATAFTSLVVNQNDLVIRDGTGKPLPYTAYCSATSTTRQLDAEDQQRFLQMDGYEFIELSQLAASICADAATPADKMAAVARFFHENFQYELRPHSYPEHDFLMQFLRDRPPAHCEYFATAGAMLLRAVDVPTRYVTGYMVTENNPTGRYWVARGRDAHAWIEAYNEDTGAWQIVECTPAAGVPSHQPQADTWSNWWDARWHQLREAIHRANSGGLLGLFSLAAALLFSPWGIAALGLLVVLVWFIRRGFRSSVEHVTRHENPFPALRKPLRRAEQLARRHGYRRRSQETLSQFANRLRQNSDTGNRSLSALADWYDAYVRVRYGQEDAGQEVTSLTGALQAVSSDLLHSSPSSPAAR
ncbi:MAG: DUF3488 and DUF4129 domain-containing transglutaminase family protein [Planctomycetaceae bacterium]